VTNDLALKLMMRHEAEVVIQVSLTLKELHTAAVIAQPILFINPY
jgi:hypothetical protein